MMQLTLPIDHRHLVLEEIHERLRAYIGQPGPWLRPHPVSQLLLGMIGGRTYERDSRRAFEALVRRFPTAEAVRDAPEAALRETIGSVTYAEVKAGRIKAALQAITTARGALTLDFLHSWAVEDSVVWLERLPGVGRKTAAVTLNFSTLRKKALVIDTHHLRVLRRLQLVGPRAKVPEAYDRVMPSLPAAWTAEDLDDHHQLMKALGQRICRHGEPLCSACPLKDLCSRTGRHAPVRSREILEINRPEPQNVGWAGSLHGIINGPGPSRPTPLSRSSRPCVSTSTSRSTPSTPAPPPRTPIWRTSPSGAARRASP